MKGWTEGDGDQILESLADDFVFENPNTGRITKPEFKAYFEDLKQRMNDFGNAEYEQFMEFSNQMHADDGETLISWQWYKILGTPVQGAALIKITDSGERSHWLTFHAQPQFGT